MTSVAQVPSDLSDEVVVKRFFRTLVETLDLIIGAAEDQPSLSELDSSVTELEEALTSLTSTSEGNELILNSNTDISKNVEYVTLHQELPATFYDFDSVAWNELQGSGQFSALGSAMTNAPFAVTAGVTYKVYVENVLALGGGVVQRVLMENTGTDLKVFYRTGDTFALALTNGWTQV